MFKRSSHPSPAHVQPHITTIRNYVALFPKGEMEKEMWKSINLLIEGKQEWELPPCLLHNPGASLNNLKKLCRALQAIADAYEDNG